jgi:hypothetical protein
VSLWGTTQPTIPNTSVWSDEDKYKGDAATITIGSTVTGSPSKVENSGSTKDVILDFTLEKGDAFVYEDFTPEQLADLRVGNTEGNTEGNTIGNTIGNTENNTLNNTAGNTVGNTVGNTLNNTDENTIGNTEGNTEGNTIGNHG